MAALIYRLVGWLALGKRQCSVLSGARFERAHGRSNEHASLGRSGAFSDLMAIKTNSEREARLISRLGWLSVRPRPVWVPVRSSGRGPRA